MKPADHFTPVAQEYARYRPRYPDALFDFLATLVGAQARVWDCAAGSGQATAALAQRFAQVIATDISFAQLQQAPQHAHVHYYAARAEQSGLAAASVDLITIAQALHWFDFERFYDEVRRVLRPDGIIAAWSYGPLHTADAALNDVVQYYYREVVGPYWPPERQWIEERYRTIPFPFDPITVPQFTMIFDWSLDDLIGYLASWSATARYVKARGMNPLIDLRAQLQPRWGATRSVTWPLAMRVGRLR